MSFQTNESFVHLWKHKLRSESFLMVHRQRGTTTIKAQKHSKDVVKMVHVTSVVQL